MMFHTFYVKRQKGRKLRFFLSLNQLSYTLLILACYFNTVLLLSCSTFQNSLSVSLSTEPVFVVVRLAENGCLLNRLKKNRDPPYVNVKERQIHFSYIDRLRIARDIANGMLHLSNKKVKYRIL